MRNTLIALLLFVACNNANKIDEQYLLTLQNHRDAITYQFIDKNTSPLNANEIIHFKGLIYFDANAEFIVNAKFIPITKLVEIELPHTQNKTYTYTNVGILEFNLNNSLYQLTAFSSNYSTKADSILIVIPFTDETNGKSTYGGGRLLEFKIANKAHYTTLDFNYAFNPYCAFNSEYSCPIPPKENHLAVSINAGEKYNP
ncbi:MAG: DUF1684 domain-containing protein [Bacteroidia bacterium]|nr:DUF1684 domain-containing protein [Bacteroidia bacterium]